MNKLNIIKTQFCLGISKPLDILNKNIRKLINFALDNNLYIHTSISYPVNFFFIKFLLNKKRRHKVNFICKILGDNFENFNKTVDLTFKKFGLKKIHTLQLVNLPIIGTYRDKNSIKTKEMEKILNLVKDLKKNKKVEKVYIQILSKDNLEFCRILNESFDGFAFYANLKEIHLKKDVFEFIKNNNLPCIILSVFGNPKKGSNINQNTHTESYNFSQSYFTNNTIAVGRTLKLSRIEDIYNLNINNKSNTLEFNPNFIETEETQENSENFFKRYKVTNIFYISIFLTKCLIKKILGPKIIKLLKK